MKRNPRFFSANTMKIVCAGLFLTGLSPNFSFAAPAVTGASGTITHGGPVTISGSGFGSHTMKIESLQANIEAGTTGQALSRSGWKRDWGWANPLYATDSVHSGSKSLKCSLSSSNYNCAFAYDMPSVTAGQRFYASWWVKYSGQTSGQWKMFRASKDQTIVDGGGQAVLFNWLDLSGQVNSITGTGSGSGFWPHVETFPVGNNKWYRVELDFIASSNGQANGSLTVRTTTDTGAIFSETFTGARTHASGDAWNHAIWQNYIGNGITNATIWFDDIYLQYNTPARVELCSGSTWNSRGKCEVQVPTSWGTSSISAAINTGSFPSGSNAYFYVVDSSGTANSTGHKVAIGSSSTSSPTTPEPTPNAPPAPVLNVIKIN
jgi:hypothetical protein